MDWLKKHLAGDTTATLEISKEEENFSGLNMKTVIDAHLAWSGKLLSTLHGLNNETIDIPTVRVDDHCVLGKWLYSTAKEKFSHLPEYSELKMVHQQFHLCAADILKDHKEGMTERAYKKVEGDFKLYSSRVQLKIIQLYAAAMKESGKI
jgi:hypothetical protein